ncbi:MAG: FkbM family methyltransferase [Bacteroidota bacterium]
MDTFKTAFQDCIVASSYNSYGSENYDTFRFGSSVSFPIWKNYFNSVINLLKKVIHYRKKDWETVSDSFYKQLTPYHAKLERLYATLPAKDKEVLLSLLAYRFLGFTKVKLARNNVAYRQAVEVAKGLKLSDETYDPQFIHFILEKFDLKAIGYDIKLFFSDVAIAIDFIIEQYAYQNDTIRIEAQPGDTVLDIGGCWGDTALYFAHKVGSAGKVFSFEFIPNNLKLHQINRSLNPNLADHITVVDHPVSNTTGQTIYYKDNGPSSKMQATPFNEQTGSTTTLTIDDFVKQYQVDKVDFIKMDIEGAERYALEGALQTIKRFRPTLAIAIYHSVEDLINIPNWVLDLNLDYEIFVDHYTIHEEETILFARPKQ